MKQPDQTPALSLGFYPIPTLVVSVRSHVDSLRRASPNLGHPEQQKLPATGPYERGQKFEMCELDHIRPCIFQVIVRLNHIVAGRQWSRGKATTGETPMPQPSVSPSPRRRSHYSRAAERSAARVISSSARAPDTALQLCRRSSSLIRQRGSTRPPETWPLTPCQRA
jgi:hypothetical protein